VRYILCNMTENNSKVNCIDIKVYYFAIFNLIIIFESNKYYVGMWWSPSDILVLLDD
jgi:hypothetical protein